MGARTTNFSLVNQAEEHVSDCGYCSSASSSVQYGTWAEILSVQAYEDLIRHGWRRSGKYLYKPVPGQTCCTTYSIRLDVKKFKPSRSQRKVQRKLDAELAKGRSYLELTSRSKGMATDLASDSLAQAKIAVVSSPQVQGNTVMPHTQEPEAAAAVLYKHTTTAIEAVQSSSEPSSTGGAPADPTADLVQQLLQQALSDMIREGLLPDISYPTPRLTRPTAKLLAKLGATCTHTTPWACQVAAAAQKLSVAAVVIPSAKQVPAQDNSREAGGDTRKDAGQQAANAFATHSVNGIHQGSQHAESMAEQQAGDTDMRVSQHAVPSNGAASSKFPNHKNAEMQQAHAARRQRVAAQAAALAESLAQRVAAMLRDSQRRDSSDHVFSKVAVKGGDQGFINIYCSNAPASCARKPSASQLQQAVRRPPSAGKVHLKRAFECLAMSNGGSSEPDSSGTNALDQAVPGYSTSQACAQDGRLQDTGTPCRTGGSNGVPTASRQGPQCPGLAEAVGSVGGPAGSGQRTTWEIRTLPASGLLVEQEFDLFYKYQLRQHDDDPDEVTKGGFKAFLVDSPLIPVAASDTPEGSGVPSCGLGSFHQQYWLDGHLVAVGVVDVLPGMVSSVYCFWDPDLAHLSLGVICALQELSWTGDLLVQCPQLRYYTMGYYIPGCPKMVYKADYKPSDLLCPITYSWAPVEKVAAVLEPGRPSVLPTIPGAIDGLDASEYNITEAARQGKAIPPSAAHIARTPLMIMATNGAVKGMTTFGQLSAGNYLPQQLLHKFLTQLEKWHQAIGKVAARSCAIVCGVGDFLLRPLESRPVAAVGGREATASDGQTVITTTGS